MARGGRMETIMALPPLFAIAPPKAPNPGIGKRSKLSIASFASTASSGSQEEESRIDDTFSGCDDDGSRSVASCEIRSHSSLDESEASPKDSCFEDSVIVQPPNQPRRSPQRHSYRTKAMPNRMSLSELQGVVLDRAPQAEVAYVCIHDEDPPPESIVFSNDSPCVVPTRLEKADTVLLVVQSSEDGLHVAGNLLKAIRANSTHGVVIAMLLEQEHKLDMKPAAEKMSRLIRDGADDAILLPGDASGFDFAITVSIDKAKAYRQRIADMERRLSASRHQCDQLFWQIAHEVVPEFPEFQRGVPEIPNKMVGNIELVEILGAGAYGTVHSGLDTEGRSMAVKVTPKERIKSVDRVLKLASEFSLLQKLKHPNVVSGYHFMHCSRNLYMCMEMCGTSTLFKHIHESGAHGLLWEHARPLMGQIFDGIAYMHKMQIGHCDLKPENMAMTPDGLVKIVDFGEAVDVSEEVAPLETPKGSTPFMSPEMLELSPDWNPLAIDLWSLGVVALEMLAGNNAFVRFMGWTGKDLRSPSELRKRAGELRHVFAEHSKLSALAAFSELFRSPQNSAGIQVAAGLLELCPEQRLPAAQIAQMLNISA